MAFPFSSSRLVSGTGCDYLPVDEDFFTPMYCSIVTWVHDVVRVTHYSLSTLVLSFPPISLSLQHCVSCVYSVFIQRTKRTVSQESKLL